MMTLVGSWAAVHATRAAAGMLLAVALASALLAQNDISGLGPVRLLSPISSLLVLPTLAGVSVAVACDNHARLPLPRPARSAAARLAWAAAWLSAAALVVNLGQLTGADVSWAPIVRNVLLHGALSLAMLTAGVVTLVWVPAVLLTLTSILFGARDTWGYYWWAVTLDSTATTAHWAVLLPCAATALLAYAVWGGRSSSRSELV